jgi:hypothetical protein
VILSKAAGRRRLSGITVAEKVLRGGMVMSGGGEIATPGLQKDREVAPA